MSERLVSPFTIKVGERFRKNLGDLASLMGSIETLGFIHPIVLRADGETLVAGERRLEAAKLLGLERVPVRLLDSVTELEAYLRAERDENEERLDLSPSEKVAYGRALEDVLRPLAKERQRQVGGGTGRAGGDKRTLRKTLPNRSNSHPQVADEVAEALGISRPTYNRAKAIATAAEADPDKFGDLVERMDNTGKVTPAYQELQRRRAGEPAGQSGARHPMVRVTKRTVGELERQSVDVIEAQIRIATEREWELLAPALASELLPRLERSRTSLTQIINATKRRAKEPT